MLVNRREGGPISVVASPLVFDVVTFDFISTRGPEEVSSKC